MSETVVASYIHGYHDRLWHFLRIQLHLLTHYQILKTMSLPVVPATKKIVNNGTRLLGSNYVLKGTSFQYGHLNH